LRREDALPLSAAAGDAAALGAGRRRMKRPEKAVSPMESRIAPW